MQSVNDRLLLFGASARAAAFSALRAGLRPWCVDLFADTDLRAACPCQVLPPAEYPRGFLRACADGPPGPWMYTGGLENRPALVDALARLRPLWGNAGRALRRARSPGRVAALLREAGLSCPEVRTDLPADAPPAGRWLVKPRDGAGGSGIAFFSGALPSKRRTYLQEYVEGVPCAAAYVGGGARAALLGVTRQLVGEPWLHAAAFHYCGSVGPLELPPQTLAQFRRLGDVLAAGLDLRGVFGVDCVLRDGTPWPVEVNPRYTASIEVLEYATGIPALALHRRAFDPVAAEPAAATPLMPPGAVGKAILFARQPLVFPGNGPWKAMLTGFPAIDVLPGVADIPPAGQAIAKGRPVLTFFQTAASPEECLAKLRTTATDLDRRLFGH